MPVIVSSALVRDWALRALSALGDAREDIDALNVYPVPDGDTGTNLYLTMESAFESVEQCWVSGEESSAPMVDEAARAMSMGALMGARGNSGVIMSQILRGTSEVLGTLTDGQVLEGASVYSLLRRAADLGYEAVGRPVEGTILTVARAAADSAGVPGSSPGRPVRKSPVSKRPASAPNTSSASWSSCSGPRTNSTSDAGGSAGSPASAGPDRARASEGPPRPWSSRPPCSPVCRAASPPGRWTVRSPSRCRSRRDNAGPPRGRQWRAARCVEAVPVT